MKTNSLEKACLTAEQLRDKIRVAPASILWARKQWKHRIASLFLERKDSLDKASCRLLRSNNKDLLMELYHRIKNGEQTFEELSMRFGEGPERINGGLIPEQSLEKLPLGLAKVIVNLKIGHLSIPLPYRWVLQTAG